MSNMLESLLTPEQQQAAQAGDELPHLRVRFSSAWSHQGPGAEVLGMMTDCSFPELHGRGTLGISQGAFSLRLDPTATELRAIAVLCTALANRVDRATEAQKRGA